VQSVDARHADGGRTLMATPDSELMAACRAGDRLALERLLTPHERSLYLLCLGILRDPDDAEDAAQEAFLRALRGLPRFRGDSAVRTWLQRIAVNVCLDWKRSHRTTLPLEYAEQAPSTAKPVDRAVVDHLHAIEALGRLTSRQRTALILKEAEGWTAREIAEVLRWNVKRVENELYRARRALEQWRMEQGTG